MKWLAIVLVVIAAAAVVWQLRRHFRNRSAGTRPVADATDGPQVQPDNPSGFGYKCVWLAVRTDDAKAVAEALGLQEIHPCGWANGLKAAYKEHQGVFVSPPIKGWVLAVSVDLPTYDPSFPDELTPLLNRLAKRFPEVQHFATHRVVDYHAWTRMIDGRLQRSFVYLGERGEALRDVGTPDAGEAALREADRKKSIERGDSEEEYEFTPGEDDLMTVAHVWSLDPTKIHEMGLPPSVGLLGRLP